MTAVELKQILTSRKFKSSLVPPPQGKYPQPTFIFKEDFIERGGKFMCKYEIAKEKDSFKLILTNFKITPFFVLENNIQIIVNDDPRFPVNLNYDPDYRGETLILEAE